MKIHPYLTFDGNCREAMTFYAKVFGTKVDTTMTYGDKMKDETAPEDMDRIMHMNMMIGADYSLMGCDTHPVMHCKEKFNPGNNTELVLFPDTKQEADRLFAELSDGGSVAMSMQDTFWGSYHGSFTDKFGMKWMIDMPSTKEEQLKWEIKAAADALHQSAKVSTGIARRLESLWKDSDSIKKPKLTEEDE